MDKQNLKDSVKKLPGSLFVSILARDARALEMQVAEDTPDARFVKVRVSVARSNSQASQAPKGNGGDKGGKK